MNENSSSKGKLETIFNDIDNLSVNPYPVALESGMFAELPPPNIPKPSVNVPKYRSFVEGGCYCRTRNAPTHKEDCFFFENVQDMGAKIPTCSYYSQGFGFCPCENCEKYISNSTAYHIIKAKVEK